MQTTAELYTQVTNKTDQERFFGFLGPRGMTLAGNETVTVPGDLVATLGVKAATGVRRHFDAFERCLAAGRLQITSRPAPVFYDNVDEVPRSLAIQSGSLGVVDPTYADSDSEHFAAV